MTAMRRVALLVWFAFHTIYGLHHGKLLRCIPGSSIYREHRPCSQRTAASRERLGRPAAPTSHWLPMAVAPAPVDGGQMWKNWTQGWLLLAVGSKKKSGWVGVTGKSMEGGTIGSKCLFTLSLRVSNYKSFPLSHSTKCMPFSKPASKAKLFWSSFISWQHRGPSTD